MTTLGRGRGALKGWTRPPKVGSTPASYIPGYARHQSQQPQTPGPSGLMEIRITDVIDVTTFWAQLGTAKQLEDFDQYCVSLSAQCEDNAREPQSEVISVGHMLPVRHSKPGIWQRASITSILPNRIVEVFYVDTGKSGRVPISDLCTNVPPLFAEISGQAVQCNLDGAVMIEGDDEIQDEAKGRLQKLVSLSHPHGMKAIIQSSIEGVLCVSVYTIYDGHWQSLGEILRMESLLLYTHAPRGPLTLDLISSPLPLRETTPSEYDSDSSTLRECSLTPSDFDPIQSNSNKLIPIPPGPNDNVLSPSKQSQSCFLTPPPDNLVSSTSSSSIASSKEELSESEMAVTPGDIQPCTPTETPPNEAEVDSEVSLPPLISTAKHTVPNQELHSCFKLPKLTIPLFGYGKLLSPKTPPMLEGSDEEYQSPANEGASPVERSKPHSESPRFLTPPEAPSSSFIVLEPTVQSDNGVHSGAVLASQATVDLLSNPANEEHRESSPTESKKKESSTDTQATTSKANKEPNEPQMFPDPSPNETGQPEQKQANREENLPQKSNANSTTASHPSSLLRVEESGKGIAEPPKLSKNGAVESDSITDSSDDDSWDESLLPPRSTDTTPLQNTPLSTPDKQSTAPVGERAWPAGKNRKKTKAQFGALMASSSNEGCEPSVRGKGNWIRGGKRGNRWGNGSRNTEQPWQQQDNRSNGRRGGTWGAGFANIRGSPRGRGAFYPDDRRGHFTNRDQFESYPENFRKWGGGNEPGPVIPQFEDQSFNSSHNSKSHGLMPHQLQMRNSEPPSQSTTPRIEGMNSRDSSMSLNVPPKVEGLQMTGEEAKNEYEWNSWKIQNQIKKMMSKLTEENVAEFGDQVQEVLEDNNAKVLVTLGRGKPPLAVVMDCILTRVVEEKNNELIQQAVDSTIKCLSGLSEPMVYKCLQEAIFTVAEDVSVGCCDSVADKRRQRLCSFIKKLFISATYSGHTDYAMSVGHSVKRCLSVWINCSTQAPQHEQLACVDCFVALCTDIGPTLDACDKESLDEYFNGSVKEAIFSNDHSREVKERLYQLALKRAAGWDGAEPDLPPQKEPGQESYNIMPAQNSLNQPAPLSPTPSVHSVQNIATSAMPQDFHFPPSSRQDQSLAQMLPQPRMPQTQPELSIPIPIETPQYGLTFNQTVSQATQLWNPNVQSQPNAPLQAPNLPQGHNGAYQVDRVNGSEVQSHQDHPTLHLAPSNPGYLSQHYYRETQQSSGPSMAPQQSIPQVSSVHEQQEPIPEADPYKGILEMLESLGFPELLPQFQQHMLMDFILESEIPTIKECLQKASVPLGAVVRIMTYVENKQKLKHTRRKPSGSRSTFSAVPKLTYRGPTPTPPARNPAPQMFDQTGFGGPVSPPVPNATIRTLASGYVPVSPPARIIVPNSPPMAIQTSYNKPISHPLAPSVQNPASQMVAMTPYEPEPSLAAALPNSVSQAPAPVSQWVSAKPQMKVALPAGGDTERKLSPLTRRESDGSDSSNITVRLPREHADWYSKPEPQAKAKGSRYQQHMGGFGTFSCLLCHSTTHTTMECKDKADRFFMHV